MIPIPQQLTFRPFQAHDFATLSQVIRQTWHYDRFLPPAAARRQANAFLSACLAEQTFTQVALDQGTPVGIIMGKDLRAPHPPFSLRLRALGHILLLLLSRPGRTIARFYQQIDAVDRNLLQRTGHQYQGELSFFVVHPDWRGKGVGKALYQAFLDHMAQQQVRDFYVFTDTSCHYPFYERQGMVLCGQQTLSLTMEHTHKEITFFIYDHRPEYEVHSHGLTL